VCRFVPQAKEGDALKTCDYHAPFGSRLGTANLKALALVSLLLLSLGAGILCIQRVSANFIPEQAPAGIVIRADGVVEGTNLINCAGNVYTFTGDIDRTIVVLRDGIVIDGAGHSLQGSGSSVGFFLQARKDVEIRNVTISNFDVGIKFTWLVYGSTAATINTVTANRIINNTYGVVFSDPYTSVTLRNNEFLDNKYGILDSVANGNYVDASNTVNGKPICYWVDQHDRTVPSDSGFVVLKNCSGIIAKDLDLEGNEQGILLYYTNSSVVEENFIANNAEGITLRYSFNNMVTGNHISLNSKHGIHLESNSEGNVVSGNRIELNGGDGVYDGYYSFGGSPGNKIIENQITNNGGNGVTIYVEQDSEIFNNNITLNGGCGIRLAYGATNMTVKGNFIAKNALGIQIESPSQTVTTTDTVVNGTVVGTTPITTVPKGSTITENTVIENYGWGIRLNNSEGGNIIYHNNFINNHVTDGLQVSIPAIMVFDLHASPDTGPRMAPGNPNVWDNGQEGNYWSDYVTRYPNASQVGNSSVGDTPFYINENNIDHFPLLKPISLQDASTSPPTTTPTSQDNSTAPDQQDASHVGTDVPNGQILTIMVVGAGTVAVAVMLTMLLRQRKNKPKT
jgi:parallel beta-helix repeat protein